MKGTLKNIGGSRSDHWNNLLANQTVQALWLKHSDPAARDNQYSATVAALVGIGPKDELEGMMAAQLIAVMRVLLVSRPSRARPLVERHGTGNTSRICADRRPARSCRRYRAEPRCHGI